MSAAPFRLIAFDMDDTLFPEMDYVRSGYVVVAERIAIAAGQSSHDVLDRMWTHFRTNRRTVFDAILAEFGLADRLSVPDLVSLYRSHVPRIQLRAGATEILTVLRAAGMHLGIVTDGPLVMQQAKFRALDLQRYVDRIIFTDTLPPGCAKPSPAAFQQLMDEFRVPPAECMYVADNPLKDFMGPRQLGWFTVQLLGGGIYSAETATKEGHPHIQIHCLSDVLHLLNP